MSNIFKIVKKEIDKIFKFPRMIFSTLILPGLLIFLIYSFMGQGISSSINKGNEYISDIYIINEPESFHFARELEMNINFITSSEEIEQLELNIKEGLIDAVIIFDENFDQLVTDGSVPQVRVIFNYTKTNSSSANTKLQALINIQKNNILENLEINPNIFSIKNDNLYDEAKAGGQVLAMILPMLIITFIFASALGIGSDAIAGEKERGTLATLLMTPIKRNGIIIGKIISTAVITMFSAFSSFIGVIASLPFAKSMFEIDAPIAYRLIDYLAILGILLLISILASSILLITSTIARTVKEATTYAMPIYIIAIIVPAMTMLSTHDSNNIGLYFIPIYNCTIGFREILSMDIQLVNYLIIILSTISYISLIIFVLMKLFKSERVLFSK